MLIRLLTNILAFVQLSALFVLSAYPYVVAPHLIVADSMHRHHQESFASGSGLILFKYPRHTGEPHDRSFVMFVHGNPSQ